MKKFFRLIWKLLKISVIPFSIWFINNLIFSQSKAPRKSQIKEHIYEWRYGDVRYIVAGQGQPLLLVHSPGSCLDEWESSLAALSKHHKVYCLDMLGFGYSDKPGVNYSAYMYVTLINDFIRDIIKTKTGIVANGHAGAFAVMAYSFCPERYDRMLLISPAGIGSSGKSATKENLWVKWLLELPLVGTTIFNILCSKLSLRWLFKNYILHDPSTMNGRMLNRYYHASHYGGPEARYSMAALLTGFLNVNIEGKLKDIKIPVHVIWGENNKLNPIENYQVIKAVNPDIGLTVFKHSGVLPHVESPKAFYKECILFFKGDRND